MSILPRDALIVSGPDTFSFLQSLVSQGAVDRKVNGVTKKYKGVPARMLALRAEMKTLRADWNESAQAKAAAAAA